MLVPSPGSTVDLQSTISSTGPVVLSLLAAIAVILGLRIAYIWLVSTVLQRSDADKISTKGTDEEEGQGSKPARYWEMFTLNSLPISLVPPPQVGPVGSGVGITSASRKQLQAAQNWVPPRNRGSATQSRPGMPVHHLFMFICLTLCAASPYQRAQAPISMAKMIMSRHVSRPHRQLC